MLPIESQLERQRQVLEMVVRGRPLAEVLRSLADIVHAQLGESADATIRLSRATGSTPPDSNRRTLPILSPDGQELGAFSMVLQDPGPSTETDRLTEFVIRTAALAIEHDAMEARLRASARRDRFLAALAAATQPLAEAADIIQTSARLLAEELDVDRCAYAPVEDERVFVITGNYLRGLPDITGRWNVEDFGPGCVEDMLGGRPYVVEDTDSDPRIDSKDLEAYRATGIRAVVCVPLHKMGRFTAAMAVHQMKPRRFTTAEIELVATVTARCWEALERVSSRREAERAIIENRSRLDYVARLSGVGFWYSPLPFNELLWDERVKDHFHLPADAHVTIADFYDRIHPEDREPTRIDIDTAIRDRNVYDTVYRTVNPANGAVKWIRALGGATYAADGTPTYFDGVTVDVSAQKRDQERLARVLNREREQARLLEEQDRRKDEFLATLAHELRNPLAPIRTGLHVLRMGGTQDQVARTHEMMERQLKHLVRLVDDLLDISRITLGKVELKKERTDFRAVLGSALETTRPLIEAANHELAVRLPSNALPLDADPTRLAQVLANLLNNAAKYTPRGGRIQLTAEVEGPTLAVRVSDTGVGIPADMLTKVFDIFTQVEPSIDQSQGGLGIGLTLVRRLLEMHGGSVEAESAGANAGSTFIIRLPLAGQAEVSSPIPAPPASARARRILVVDDNNDAAETLSMLLSLDGHDTRVANDGESAVVVAGQFLPDTVFLDIGLPGMNGYETARHLRQAHGKLVRIIALTGWGDAEHRQRAHEAGFDGHLVKPVDPALLAAALQ
ncbi:MAG TPA: ATP-binding protein [Steroidobacteraceae bacterium]|nr:ATP-binding protein [Steroidobacteraceae bacterium]